MQIDNEIYQQIDLYLEGKLSGKELLDFENELLTNKVLQNKISTVKQLNHLILDYKLDELKYKMSSDLKNIPYKNGYKLNALKIATLVAVISFAGIGYCFYNQTNNSDNKIGEEIKNTHTHKQTISSNNNAIVEQPKQVEKVAPTVERKWQQEKQSLNISSGSIENEKVSENFVEKETAKVVDVATPLNDTKATNLVASKVSVCDYKILFHIQHQASCKNGATGSLKISDFKNGNSPYLVSVNNSTTFENATFFQDLTAGNYKIQIQDNNGCLSEVYSHEIPVIDCNTVKNEFAFNPSLNETFKFPIESGDEGNIKILTRNGQLVFSANFPDVQEWHGDSNTGFGIEAGVYVYVIEHKNGKLQKGFVTLY